MRWLLTLMRRLIARLRQAIAHFYRLAQYDDDHLDEMEQRAEDSEWRLRAIEARLRIRGDLKDVRVRH